MSTDLIQAPVPPYLDALIRLFAGDSQLITPQQREQFGKELAHRKMLPSKDMMVMWDLLHELVDPAWRPDDTCSILDLACGRCEEVFVLSSFLASRMENLRPECVKFFASDIREGILMRGKESCAQTCRYFEHEVGGKYSPFRYAFRAGDATLPETWATFPEQFDVVFFRHQNMYHGMDIWTKIFANVLPRLKPNGRLIITSYFDREHTIALNVFKSLGAELIKTIRNPRSRILVTEGKSVDRHIAILQVCDKVQ